MFENYLDGTAWKADLLTKKDVAVPGVRSNNANVALALMGDPHLAGVVAHDDFALALTRSAHAPWNRTFGRWSDADNVALSDYLQREGLDVNPDIVSYGVLTAAMRNRIHPVQDYLRGLEWDGEERLSSWLTTYLGVESTPYSKAVGTRFLIAAVARVMNPGCKADTMLVLEGRQGIGKSSAVKTLFGEHWFADSLPQLSSKEAAMQIQGKWVVEVAELEAFRRSEITDIKAFLSRSSDRFRAPYARFPQDSPRQCVFVGTTNSDDYLKDASGNRRFWPVRCDNIDLPRLATDREQIWAEALELFVWGMPWHLTPDEEVYARAEQSARLAEDVWAPQIDAYVWSRQRVTTEEILEYALGVPIGRRDQLARMRVNAHLTRWGWEHRKSGGQRPFLRPDPIPAEKLSFADGTQAIPKAAYFE
jgi:putative DNA primase/helicase